MNNAQVRFEDRAHIYTRALLVELESGTAGECAERYINDNELPESPFSSATRALMRAEFLEAYPAMLAETRRAVARLDSETAS